MTGTRLPCIAASRRDSRSRAHINRRPWVVYGRVRRPTPPTPPTRSRRRQAGGSNKTSCSFNSSQRMSITEEARGRHGRVSGETPGSSTPRCHRIPPAVSCAVKAPNTPATDITGASSCLTAATPFDPEGGCSSTLHKHLHLEISLRTCAINKAETRALVGQRVRGPRALACPSPRDLNRR